MCVKDLFQFCAVSVHTIHSLRVAAPYAPYAPSAPSQSKKGERERARRVRVLVGYTILDTFSCRHQKVSGQCKHNFRWCKVSFVIVWRFHSQQDILKAVCHTIPGSLSSKICHNFICCLGLLPCCMTRCLIPGAITQKHPTTVSSYIHCKHFSGYPEYF